MKKFTHYLLFVSLISLLVSCNGKTDGTASGDGSDSTDVSSAAICVWDKTSLRETPEEKGKWLASLSIGEKCTYLDDTKEEDTGTRTVKYIKVQLQDGKEGWVQSDLVIVNSKAATLINNAEIYSRPDLLTKTGKLFSKMDVVAVKTSQNDFIEVVGKRKDGKWIESGWIKPSNISYADYDIAVAKFGSKALQITDKQKQIEAINEIINNDDLKKSVFITDLQSVTEAQMEPVKVDTSDLQEETVN